MPFSPPISPNLMLRQQAIDWLIRLRSDDLNEAEIMAFADWLALDHEHSAAFAAAESLFEDMVQAVKTPAPVKKPDVGESSTTQVNHLAPKLVALNPAKPFPSKTRTPVHASIARPSAARWIAASVAIAAAWLFAVTLVIPSQSRLLDNYFSDYHTATGELREIQLADGSHLLLNTDSAVSVNFNTTLRRISLHHGQARFTVAKDAQRPFVVLANGLEIQALGTVFEVYDHSGEVNVIVQEHAVAVHAQTGLDKPASATLQQGQQLQYHPGGGLTKPTGVDLSQSSAWQQHRLFINDRPLGELLTELGRYRIGRIFLSDNKLKELRVTGVFSLENPEDVLSSITKTLNLKVSRLGPWWLLLHR